MKASKDALSIIEHFEGYSHVAYLCSAKVWTIGIGTTIYPDGRKVKKGDTCTKAEAVQWLMMDIVRFERLVLKNIKVKLTQNQFDALVSFFYNCGVQRGFVNTINKAKDLTKIWGNFLLYSKVRAQNDGIDNDGDGIVDEAGEMQELKGLVRRRNCEAHLFTLGTLNFYENIK